MAGISSLLYNSLFRRNAAFLSTVFVGAFAFEMIFDTGANRLWDTINRGRQWKDIKQQYLNKAEEDEE